MLPPDYTKSDGDIYGKGALILNALRFYIGDEAFFKALRRTTYPDPKMERVTDGRQFHFETPDDFRRTAERESGKDLKWFFEVYLRQPALPKLVATTSVNQLNLQWQTPNNMPFPMPVEVKIGNEIKRVEIPDGKGGVMLPADAGYEIDPHGWVLKAQN